MFTEYYSSPEFLASIGNQSINGKIDPYKSDVFSLGITILEMINLRKK